MNHTVKIRELILGDGQPKICVPLVAEDEAALDAALAGLQDVPFDLVEFRADFFKALFAEDLPETERYSMLTGLLQKIRRAVDDRPVLFTVRTSGEGGEAVLSLPAYTAMLTAAAMTCLADLIDVELFTAGEQAAALTGSLHNLGAAVIGSSHDFKRTPPRAEMRRRLMMMQDAGMDIGKLAVMPENRQDVAELISLSCEMTALPDAIPLVTMSMGSLGVVTRVCGSLTGSAITFASAGKASAPGQIDASLMREVLDILRNSQSAPRRS